MFLSLLNSKSSNTFDTPANRLAPAQKQIDTIYGLSHSQTISIDAVASDASLSSKPPQRIGSSNDLIQQISKVMINEMSNLETSDKSDKNDDKIVRSSESESESEDEDVLNKHLEEERKRMIEELKLKKRMLKAKEKIDVDTVSKKK